MKGLWTGLGDENGFSFGDFGDGICSGGGIFGLAAKNGELLSKLDKPKGFWD
jgi:hypothetical protein